MLGVFVVFCVFLTKRSCFCEMVLFLLRFVLFLMRRRCFVVFLCENVCFCCVL